MFDRPRRHDPNSWRRLLVANFGLRTTHRRYPAFVPANAGLSWLTCEGQLSSLQMVMARQKNPSLERKGFHCIFAVSVQKKKGNYIRHPKSGDHAANHCKVVLQVLTAQQPHDFYSKHGSRS